MTQLFAPPRYAPLSFTGETVPGAKLWFYEVGSTTPQDVYTARDGQTKHENPVRANAAGLFPAIWLADALYDVECTDEDGATQWTRESVGALAPLPPAGPFPLTDYESSQGYANDDVNTNYPSGDVRRYGAVVDGVTNDAAAINTAITIASEAGGLEVVLGPGVSRVTSDVVISSHVHLRGHQRGSVLDFVNSGLYVDPQQHIPTSGSGRHAENFGFTNFTVQRSGTAGPAVRIIGDGGTGASDNQDAVRFNIDCLHIASSTGDGLETRGTYLGGIYNLLIENCLGTGWLIAEEAGSQNTGLNAVGVFGGEIHGCGKALDGERLIGVAFYNVAFEGNNEGVDLRRNSQNVELANCYFEANGTYDLRIGNSTTVSYDVLARNCRFIEGGLTKDYAVELVRGIGVGIENCSFQSYAVAGIHHAPASSGAVTGSFRNCQVTGTTPALASGENTFFHRDPAETVLTATLTWGPFTVPNGGNTATNVPLAAAAVGDFVQASPSGGLSDLQLTAYVNTTGNVRLILSNTTGGPINQAALTYRVFVRPRSPAYF